MDSFKLKSSETVHLWLAIVIVFLLAGFRMVALLVPRMGLFWAPLLQTAVWEWFVNGLFLYILALLWVAYHRWRATIVRKHDLEIILKTISPDVLLVVSPDRLIVESNELVRDVFGYEPEEVIGRQTDLLYFDRRVTKEKREIFVHLERVGFHVGQAKGRRKDGSVFPIELMTVEMKRQSGAVLLIRDITEHKRAEENILRAKEDAEAAHAEKSRLLGELEINYAKLQEMERVRDNLSHMIVHDLKSPLTSLIAYIDLLRHTAGKKLAGDEVRFLDEAIAQGDRLTEMINSILDISRLESGKMPLNRQSCETAKLLDDALRIAGPEAAKRDVSPHIAPDAGRVVCDGAVITRVLNNLITNAVKFTKPGGAIRVSVQKSGGGLRFVVTDSGSGIPKEQHERIFERFVQAEPTPYSTGLGLTFCKLAVEAHGGKIGVESEPGKGSSFWFVLP
jgi:PAS domain S-box-containing protein